MPIGDGKSVLLLGAGVSAPFNIPIGGSMIEAIGNQLRAERRVLGASSGDVVIDSSVIGQAANNASKFYKIPIHASLGLREKNVRGYSFVQENFRHDMEAIWNFGRLLQDQTSDSIDDFIIQNPGLAEVSKIAIASIIFLRCYKLTADGQSVQIQPLSARRTDALFSTADERNQHAERNWIHILINIAREKYYSFKPDPMDRIKIITFNYDMILEHVLQSQFENTQHKYGPYKEYFDILHVHGQCGELSSDLSNNCHSMIRGWAEGIHVVRSQSIADNVAVQRETAQKWIRSARFIHAAGFAFARANVKLLGLDKSEQLSKLNYCNYNRSVGVKKNADVCRIGFREVIEDCNEDSRPLRVSDWFSTGYAGELPS